MFQPGDERSAEKRQKVYIKPYSVIAPRANEFHQHFNTAKGPLRQLAFKGWVRRPLSTNSKGEYDSVGAARSDDPAGSSFKIRYDREDPKIREEYYIELERNGVSLRLEPVDQGG